MTFEFFTPGYPAICREAGYHLVVESMDNDAHDLGEQVHRMVSTLRPDGMILTPPLCDNPHVLKALHDSGAAVVLNDRTAESVEMAIARLGGGDRLCAAPADLATPGGPALAVKQAAAVFGRLDILINNAAVNIERPIEETDDAH